MPEWSFNDLTRHFPIHICDAVLRLTKTKGELYSDYMQRIKGSVISVKVKISDLRDNMDLSRIQRPLSEKDIERTQKYHNAYLELINHCKENGYIIF